MNIKYSRKWVIIGIVFMGVFFAGCARPSVEQLTRDQDTEFEKGSQLNYSTFSKEETINLAKLSKVWGIVKYYHPQAVVGEVNMDYELFRVMPLILEKDADVNLVLLEWVKSLGEIEQTSQQENIIGEELIQLNRSTQWAEDEDYLGKKLSTELTKLLQTTISHRENGYVSFSEEDLYGSIENEENYPMMDPADTGYRLLGLFRYWNIIEYYYPYKDIIEEDWDEVLEEFIPKFIDGTDHQSYAMTIAELTTKIHDTHASVVNGAGKDVMSYFGEYWLPASFVEIDGQLVINKAADAITLKNGDILLSIEGKEIDEIIQERRDYQSQSREDIVTSSYLDVFRTPEENVNVIVIRDGKQVELAVETTQQAVSADIEMNTQRLKNEENYYINAGQLKDGEISEIMQEAKDTEGLILDMRNYPTSFMLYELAEYLIPQETVFAKASIPNPAVPGDFYFVEPLVSGRTEDTNQADLNNFYDGKAILLMNEQTISQGEFTIMSTRNAENAVLLGRESAGADGNVIPFILPGNVATTMSGVGIYYPNETPTQRVGIKPDIYLEPTIEGIKAGRDEYLEKAIEIIKAD